MTSLSTNKTVQFEISANIIVINDDIIQIGTFDLFKDSELISVHCEAATESICIASICLHCVYLCELKQSTNKKPSLAPLKYRQDDR